MKIDLGFFSPALTFTFGWSEFEQPCKTKIKLSSWTPFWILCAAKRFFSASVPHPCFISVILFSHWFQHNTAEI